MAGATARYNMGQQRIDVIGHGYADYDGYTAFAPIEELLPASWLRMRNALRALAEDQHENVVRVALARTARQHFDEDLTPEEPIGFLYKDNELFVEVETAFDDEPDPRALRRVLEPFLRRRRARLDRIEVIQPADFHIAHMIVAPPRISTLRDGYAFAEEVAALVGAVHGGEVGRDSALDLIRADRVDLLVGQPEGDWLDAKRLPYALAQDDQKYELAKDAASFANGSGGLIVLGLATVKRDDVDVISRVLEFRLADVNLRRYRDILNRYVFPRIERLDVLRVSGIQAGQGVAVVAVPAQRDELKPFLVHGVLVGGDVRGEFVGIPIRSGEETAWRDLQTLHAQIRLGEAALHGPP